MNKVTMSLPTGNNETKEIYRHVEVSGEAVGPFLVHRCICYRRGWTVTHMKSKFAAHVGLPTKKRAMWLAKELGKLDVWNFDNFEEAKLIPKDVLAAVKVMRADAMFGDMQGSVA